jgi:hypothetical protein
MLKFANHNNSATKTFDPHMNITTFSSASVQEIDNRNRAAQAFRNCPIPDNEVLANSSIFLKRQELTKILFFDDLYKNHVLGHHGVLLELGVRWGRNMVLWNNLRGIYEPFNHHRKIIGFDTFEGFPSVDAKDGNHEIVKAGGLNVTKGFETYLGDLLAYHESECPLSHIPKNSIIKGDAVVELKKYLEAHPETTLAMVWFDFDIYQPTRDCLELLKPYISKGTVLGFDELCDPTFPGETVALREVFGLNSVEIRRNKYSGAQSYIIVE